MSNRIHSQAAQRGVTMIVALIMLAIIGMVSASVMRSSLSTDQVANNARMQNFAAKSADVALRHCEAEFEGHAADPLAVPPVVASLPTITPEAFVPGNAKRNWETFATWNTAVVYKVSGAAKASVTAVRQPECMVEFGDATGHLVIVTARGFSPDYSEDGSGRTLTGSVVWVQSFLSI